MSVIVFHTYRPINFVRMQRSSLSSKRTPQEKKLFWWMIGLLVLLHNLASSKSSSVVSSAFFVPYLQSSKCRSNFKKIVVGTEELYCRKSIQKTAASRNNEIVATARMMKHQEEDKPYHNDVATAVATTAGDMIASGQTRQSNHAVRRLWFLPRDCFS